MNEILDIEIILKRKKYPFIYNIGTILTIIFFAFIYISHTYKYKTYYQNKATMIDNKLELIVNINDIKYIINNNKITIDDQVYKYSTYKISKELYVDETFNNYKYVYLEVNNLKNINNYVYEIKIQKENKQIIKYIKDYL